MPLLFFYLISNKPYADVVKFNGNILYFFCELINELYFVFPGHAPSFKIIICVLCNPTIISNMSKTYLNYFFDACMTIIKEWKMSFITIQICYEGSWN